MYRENALWRYWLTSHEESNYVSHATWATINLNDVDGTISKSYLPRPHTK